MRVNKKIKPTQKQQNKHSVKHAVNLKHPVYIKLGASLTTLKIGEFC